MKLPKPPENATDPKPPLSRWDKIVTSTPVVMTVLATLLAGLSSSESNQAQYYRSLSAQNQSKAGDQWNFFQAKKLRAANAITSLKLMRNLGDVRSLSTDSLMSAVTHFSQILTATPNGVEKARAIQEQIVPLLADPGIKSAMELLASTVPAAEELTIIDPKVREAYESLRKNRGETTPPALFGKVNTEAMHEALLAADRNAQTSDAALQPAMAGVAKIEKLLDLLANVSVSASLSATQAATRPTLAATDRESPAEVRQLATDFTAAGLRFDAARHDREARLNQQTAYLYEVAVRKTSWQSDRSLIRSRYFFYGMLGAQAAVLIATFSLAVRERSGLWILAASIGTVAMTYAGYVYLFT